MRRPYESAWVGMHGLSDTRLTDKIVKDAVGSIPSH